MGGGWLQAGRRVLVVGKDTETRINFFLFVPSKR